MPPALRFAQHRSRLRSSSVLLQPPVPCACGCGTLHTERDKAFVEFLTDEIEEEKRIRKHKSLPKMSGDWELEVDGTEATLLRKVAGEKITVTFNINNSNPPTFDREEEPSQGQKAEEQEPELTSTPNFVVEVTKIDDKKSLVLDCHSPEDEIYTKMRPRVILSLSRKLAFRLLVTLSRGIQTTHSTQIPWTGPCMAT